MDSLALFSGQPLTRQVMLSLLHDYKRPYDKISEWLKEGKLTVVKRGVYMAGPNTTLERPENFLLANHLSGPSYISMDSALSYWGMIPEKVFETTSASIDKTILYKTAAGRFRYTKIPAAYYPLGIRSIELTPKQHVLIATAEKALCDKIISSPGVLLRSIPQTKALLLENLRIDRTLLTQLDFEQIKSWQHAAPKATSLNILIKTLETL